MPDLPRLLDQQQDSVASLRAPCFSSLTLVCVRGQRPSQDRILMRSCTSPRTFLSVCSGYHRPMLGSIGVIASAVGPHCSCSQEMQLCTDSIACSGHPSPSVPAVGGASAAH